MKLSKSVQREFTTVTTLSKFIALVLFIVFPFLGFFFGMQYQQVINQNEQLIDAYKWNSYQTENQPMESILGKFTGVLPCADCEGIRTSLTLNVDSKNMAPRTFELTEVYQGKSEMPMVRTGNWLLLKGTKKDPEAVIYELTPDDTSEAVYYLKINEKVVQLLDKNQAEIKSKLNYSLVKE